MRDHIAALSLKQKIGQLFFVGIPGADIDDATAEFLNEISPGGVCLFARNIKDAQQTRHLLDDLRGLLPVTPFLSVDQEGGLVDRLKRILAPMPPANRLANPDDAGEHGKVVADALVTLGFNMDFAPVVDVADERRSAYTNGLTSRTFGSSKEEVVAFAAEFLRALQDKGITGCLKHFPGLAASRVDSHEELPLVEIDEDELKSVDLFPYRKLLSSSDVRAVMVAHAAFPRHRLQETDQNGKLLPSSLSYNFVTTLLRDQLGFNGLVITDDLEMGAIVRNYGMGDACVRALAAGCDMLAICADPNAVREGYRAVLQAVNDEKFTVDRLETSLNRIARAKAHIIDPAAYDPHRPAEISAEIAKFNQRLGH